MANPRICSIDGCDKKHFGRDYCRAHYQRWRRHGSAVAGRTACGEKMAWLEANAEFCGDECLFWPFSDKHHPYGRLHVDGEEVTATRMMCKLAHGPAPTPVHEAAHSCGNPECRNPKHLRWATSSENNCDKADHGTDNRGERHSMVRLTESDVRYIRTRRGIETNLSLAKHFGVSKATISHIQTRRNWSWLMDNAA